MIVTKTISEKEVIEQCLRGDSRAQHELYRRYADAMLNVAYRILKNEETAKDVLQDSFLKAFRELPKLKNRQGFAAWLKRIVINTTINQAKKKGLVLTEMEEFESFAERQEEESPVFDIDKVRKALLQLPDGYRTVLTLYLIEGYDHEEISQILNISKSTSLTQYSRGKKRLLELIRAAP